MSLNTRLRVIEGLAKLVELVNQYAAQMVAAVIVGLVRVMRQVRVLVSRL